jgi:hypothetical protein
MTVRDQEQDDFADAPGGRGTRWIIREERIDQQTPALRRYHEQRGVSEPRDGHALQRAA